MTSDIHRYYQLPPTKIVQFVVTMPREVIGMLDLAGLRMTRRLRKRYPNLTHLPRSLVAKIILTHALMRMGCQSGLQEGFNAETLDIVQKRAEDSLMEDMLYASKKKRKDQQDDD